jgi:hypothetical protein
MASILTVCPGHGTSRAVLLLAHVYYLLMTREVLLFTLERKSSNLSILCNNVAQ